MGKVRDFFTSIPKRDSSDRSAPAPKAKKYVGSASKLKRVAEPSSLVSPQKRPKTAHATPLPATPPLAGSAQKYQNSAAGASSSAAGACSSAAGASSSAGAASYPKATGGCAGLLEMVTPDMTAEEHNTALSQVFHQLAKLEKAKGDTVRSNSYNKGALAIAAHSEKLTSAVEAKKLPGVGKVSPALVICM